ncbi:MAG TPA: HNH endonuclease signature motif containing protein [Marmoricola sp.]
MTQTLEEATAREAPVPARGVPPDLAALADHDLLAAGLVDQVVANRANARVWARLVEFHSRRTADEGVRRTVSLHFALTPRQATVAEVAELWGWKASWARKQLNVALCLSVWFPQVWEMCLKGQLDVHRAQMIADTARFKLGDDLSWLALGKRLQPWLEGHLRSVDALLPDGSPAPAVVGCTDRQLRNKLDYEVRRLSPAPSEQAHRKAVEDRAVRRSDPADGTGVGWLGVSHTVDQLMLAEQALTLAARQLRDGGDERTLDQLRADIAVDRLVGRADGVATPSFARPVINVTVPVQTVMGVCDDPGVLSGGQVIPAGLARAIAADPSSTWYRMLVDPAGEMVELSTRSYQPTDPIWRHVVAEWGGCFRPGCGEPATSADIDHRTPFPGGATSTSNLWPACEEDHKVKHAPGFVVSQDAKTGDFVMHTPSGFAHRLPRPSHPACDWDVDLPPAVQISGSELLHALHHVIECRESDLACRPEVEWELGPATHEADLIRQAIDHAGHGEALVRPSDLGV